VLDDIKRVSAPGLTFAPEAGTQRMRDVVNKNVTEEQLIETAERVFSRGWKQDEALLHDRPADREDEDVRGHRLRPGTRAWQAHLAPRRAAQPAREVTVSVSTHVPKPHTPFQWCAMDTTRRGARKQRMLRDEAATQ
jgi:radical SAM superfamily enzyme YgiQ (UPF0313 family)